MDELWIILSLFPFLILLFYLILTNVIKHNKFKKRIKKYDLVDEAPKPSKKEKTQDKKAYVGYIQKVGNQLDRASNKSKWELPLIQARSKLSPGEFLLFRLVAAAALALIGLLYGLHFLLLIPLGFIGFWIPVLDLRRKINKRLQRSTHQLAEALGTMANSMRAGFSFMQAMKLVSEEFPDPIGTEFKKTLQDIQYGVSVEEAFNRMLERLPDKELEMAVKAMLIQRASGGNLAVLLEIIQETVSGRLRIKDEVRTLTAQGKMSTWIITGLPVALALYLKLMNPDYFNTLFLHPLGYVMIGMGIIGLIMGWIFIRKIVQIEV